MRELLEKIAYLVVRIARGKVYFFDREGIYRIVSVNEAKKMNLKNFCVREDNSVFFRLENFRYYIKLYNKYLTNQTLITKAICKLEPGDKIEKFEEYLQTVKIEHKDKPKGIDRFVTKIEKPYFIRNPENTKVETFDYINVEVNIVSEWQEDRKQYIKKHQQEIWQRVIRKLEESKEFQKYGVPVNFLKAKATLTKNSVLKFTFELKK